MLIDTHAHLSDPKYSLDVNQVIERARVVGVEKIISPSGDLKDARRVVELTQQFENVYGCVGLYPGEGQKNPNWREDLAEIEKLLKDNPKIVGIGEIGLDVYWNERNEKIEREMFGEQLIMASKLKKPVIIHNRQSHKLIEEILEEQGDLPSGVFHCFSGDEKFLELVLNYEFYVGFDANITYPSNNELRELVGMVPIKRLLLETDSPYLPPQGKRGERNEPAHVRISAQMIAQIKNVSFSELEEQTTRNAKTLFNV